MAASPPSRVESLEVEDSPKPVPPTEGLESLQETPAVVGKPESGGSGSKRKAPKAKAKALSKALSKAKAKAKAKGQAKRKAKKAPEGPAKPKGNMKKKDKIERKLHSVIRLKDTSNQSKQKFSNLGHFLVVSHSTSFRTKVYSCAHSHASKVAKMSKEDAKKMAHDARRERPSRYHILVVAPH